MYSYISYKKDTNQLLRWLILASLLFHIPIYLHMNGLLTTEVLHYIDLTIRKTEDTSSRKILRPPLLFKNKSKPGKVETNLMKPVQIPENNQPFSTNNNPIQAKLSDAGTEPFSGAKNIKIGSGIGNSTSGLGESGGGTSTKDGYMEMVRLKIERNNKIPPEAIRRRRGGVVTLQFVINLDGTIRDLKIIKPSPMEVLNRQALKAVRDSAPFIKPPSYIFKEDIPMILDVHFDLY